MSRFLFYPHLRGIISRLPEYYKSRYLEKYSEGSKINYFEENLSGWQRSASDNAIYPMEAYVPPPDLIFPEEAQWSLWGGEAIVKGFIEVKRTHTRIPKTWGPDLRQHIFYSEILGRWMKIIVSLTALTQIESLKGLDNYILNKSECEINSRLGMHIKREMLLKLTDDNFKKEQPDIFKKYESFQIPREEAEWIGLTLDEAIKKQLQLEREEACLVKSVPRKVVLAKSFLKQLKKDESAPTDSKSHLPLPDLEGIKQSVSRVLFGSKWGKA